MPVELLWDGKYHPDGTKKFPLRVKLPFQTVETVNESAQERQRMLDLFSSGQTTSAWRNRFIWGDKKSDPKHFRNEIIWSYRKLARASSQFPKSHDVIFFYTKGKNNVFNTQYIGLSDSTLKRWGDRKRGGKDPNNRYATEEESLGAIMPDVWDIP